jgi:hypothetical protein
MKPHHQEKYVFLVDAGSMSFSIMTYYYMEKFMEWISIVFAGLCDKILVYNADKVGFVWDICKRWLPQSTVSKVIFCHEKQYRRNPQTHRTSTVIAEIRRSYLKPNLILASKTHQLMQTYLTKLQHILAHSTALIIGAITIILIYQQHIIFQFQIPFYFFPIQTTKNLQVPWESKAKRIFLSQGNKTKARNNMLSEKD